MSRPVLMAIAVIAAALLSVGVLVYHYTRPSTAAHLISPAYSSLPVTATPLLQCQTLGTGCRKALLQVINADRAAVGSPPLALSHDMTYGSGSCIGAAGNAKNMAAAGRLSHDDFPADVCSSGFGPFSENVGASPQPERWDALLQIHELMMSEEPYTPGCLDNHRCSLMYSGFRHVGIGYKRGNGVLYISEEFSG